MKIPTTNSLRLSYNCSSVKESFPMPVRMAAERSGLISVTPRRASFIALGISFETVPLRGEGINFLGPRIYTVNCSFHTYSSNGSQFGHISGSSQENIKVNLSRLNVVDHIIHTNNIRTTVLSVGGVLAIGNYTNTRVLSSSVGELSVSFLRNEPNREHSANDDVRFLRIDVQICSHLKGLIELCNSAISHTSNRLHGRIILIGEITFINLVPGDWGVSWTPLRKMQNSALVGCYVMTNRFQSSLTQQ